MINKNIVFLISFLLLMFSSCKPDKDKAIKLLSTDDFTRTIDNRKTSLYTLQNENGLTLQVTNYGARIVSLWTPDRNNQWKDIVLGYRTIDEYICNKGERFFGAAIGRYANRIAQGRFTIDGQRYQLSTYNNGQCLHGGVNGFDRQVWQVNSVSSHTINFSYLSKDMEEGFPGNLRVSMSYSLTNQNELVIQYTAETDKATPVNLTHHSFFNLHGEGEGTINDHILYVNAQYYTPVDSVLIPLGNFASVQGTPFDFNKPTVIGSRLDEKNQQFDFAMGYDHNFVLNKQQKGHLEFAASVHEPKSGRYLEVFTTEPGLQFYGGNFFDGAILGKNLKPYLHRGALALETQHFPDSPNQPMFPNTILQPDDTYSQTCVYKFTVK